MQLFPISEMAHAQVAPRAMKNSALSYSETNQRCQNLVTINSTTFPDTVTRTSISAIILKRLHNMFTLLPVDGHDMSK
jgi:hypothetical protein